MRKLIVSVDAIAAIREGRKEREPDPVAAAALAELAGADGIAIHLRMDKKHIRERDLYILRETVKTKLDLYISPNADLVARALEVKPAEVTLVAERPGELTTENGLDLHEHFDAVKGIAEQLQAAGCRVFTLIEPEEDSVKRASKIGLDGVEIFANHFTEAKSPLDTLSELQRITKTAESARKAELAVRTSGGLGYGNVVSVITETDIPEYVVGHNIVSRAVLTGFEKAVREMVEIVKFF
jgi:pyridoxine 5-phosphate synthase